MFAWWLIYNPGELWNLVEALAKKGLRYAKTAPRFTTRVAQIVNNIERHQCTEHMPGYYCTFSFITQMANSKHATTSLLTEHFCYTPLVSLPEVNVVCR